MPQGRSRSGTWQFQRTHGATWIFLYPSGEAGSTLTAGI